MSMVFDRADAIIRSNDCHDVVRVVGRYGHADYVPVAGVRKRDQLIRELLQPRCPEPMACADCGHDEDDGCEFMRRALEMGVEPWATAATTG